MNPVLLVLHQAAIGDFVLTMAVVQAVQESTGSKHVTAIASAPSARISAGRSVIDEWHHPDDVGLHSLFREEGEIDERLRDVLDQTDWVLNFLGDSQSLPHRRIADYFCIERPKRQEKIISIDPRPTAETEKSWRHITQQWADSIRSTGLNIGEPTPPRIQIDANREKNRVVIHPGSGGRRKCWPIENFIEVADSLTGCRVSWMLGPADLESMQFDAVGTDLICEDDLLRAVCRIADADLYIGNDAGMTHLAAAIGLPTIAIFGPTDPRVWRPLGPNVHVMQAFGNGGISQVLAVGRGLLGIG